jgi:rare lipoprotein A
LWASAFAVLGLFETSALARQSAPIVYAGKQLEMAAADESGAPPTYTYGTTQARPTRLDLRGRIRSQPGEGLPEDAFEAAPLKGTLNAADRSDDRPVWLETERVGAPYQAKDKWYVPTPEPGYEQTGLAAPYAEEFKSRRTANGEPYDPLALTAAHPTLPLPCLVQVTNPRTGREAILRVNDRGPFRDGGVLQVSQKAAEVLGVDARGAQLHVRYLGPAPKHFATRAVARPSAPAAAMRPTNVSTAASGRYVVQIGAYSNRANAQRALGSASHRGSIDPAAVGDRQIFRVRLGPWNDRNEAEAARTDVLRQFPGAVVTEVR